MFQDVFEMFVVYLQFLAIIVEQSPSSFPEFYSVPSKQLNVLTALVPGLVSSDSEWYHNPLTLEVPRWLPLDFRFRFLVISILCPLVLTVVAMFGLESKAGFLTYAMLLTSTFIFVLGAISAALPEVYNLLDFSMRARIILAAVGGPAMVLTATLGVVMMVLMRRKRRRWIQMMLATGPVGDDGVTLAEKALQREALNRGALRARRDFETTRKANIRQRNWVSFGTGVLIALLVVLVGLAFLGVIPISLLQLLQSSTFVVVSGAVLVVVGALMMLWSLTGLFYKGRRFQFNISVLLERYLATVILMVTSMLYTPVLTNLISIFYCRQLSCGAEERFSAPGSLLTANTSEEAQSVWNASTDVTIGCLACDFSEFPQRCSSDLQSALCGHEVEDMRLVVDPSIPCWSIGPFYRASAITMLIVFVATLPALYVILGTVTSRILAEEFPLTQSYHMAAASAAAAEAKKYAGVVGAIGTIEATKKAAPAEGPGAGGTTAAPASTAPGRVRKRRRSRRDNAIENWWRPEGEFYEKVRMSANIAKFVYAPYRRKFRYWRLVLIVQKLLIVNIRCLTNTRDTVWTAAEISNGVRGTVSAFGLILLTAVHLIYLILQVTARPFVRPVENILLCSVEAMATLVALLGLFGTFVTVSFGLGVVVAVLVVVVPLAGLFIGYYITFREDVKRDQMIRNGMELSFTVAKPASEPPPLNSPQGPPPANPHRGEDQQVGGGAPRAEALRNPFTASAAPPAMGSAARNQRQARGATVAFTDSDFAWLHKSHARLKEARRGGENDRGLFEAEQTLRSIAETYISRRRSAVSEVLPASEAAPLDAGADLGFVNGPSTVAAQYFDDQRCFVPSQFFPKGVSTWSCLAGKPQRDRRRASSERGEAEQEMSPRRRCGALDAAAQTSLRPTSLPYGSQQSGLISLAASWRAAPSPPNVRPAGAHDAFVTFSPEPIGAVPAGAAEGLGEEARMPPSPQPVAPAVVTSTLDGDAADPPEPPFAADWVVDRAMCGGLANGSLGEAPAAATTEDDPKSHVRSSVSFSASPSPSRECAQAPSWSLAPRRSWLRAACGWVAAAFHWLRHSSGTVTRADSYQRILLGKVHLLSYRDVVTGRFDATTRLWGPQSLYSAPPGTPWLEGTGGPENGNDTNTYLGSSVRRHRLSVAPTAPPQTDAVPLVASTSLQSATLPPSVMLARMDATVSMNALTSRRQKLGGMLKPRRREAMMTLLTVDGPYSDFVDPPEFPVPSPAQLQTVNRDFTGHWSPLLRYSTVRRAAHVIRCDDEVPLTPSSKSGAGRATPGEVRPRLKRTMLGELWKRSAVKWTLGLYGRYVLQKTRQVKSPPLTWPALARSALANPNQPPPPSMLAIEETCASVIDSPEESLSMSTSAPFLDNTRSSLPHVNVSHANDAVKVLPTLTAFLEDEENMFDLQVGCTTSGFTQAPWAEDVWRALDELQKKRARLLARQSSSQRGTNTVEPPPSTPSVLHHSGEGFAVDRDTDDLVGAREAMRRHLLPAGGEGGVSIPPVFGTAPVTALTSMDSTQVSCKKDVAAAALISRCRLERRRSSYTSVTPRITVGGSGATVKDWEKLLENLFEELLQDATLPKESGDGAKVPLLGGPSASTALDDHGAGRRSPRPVSPPVPSAADPMTAAAPRSMDVAWLRRPSFPLNSTFAAKDSPRAQTTAHPHARDPAAESSEAATWEAGGAALAAWIAAGRRSSLPSLELTQSLSTSCLQGAAWLTPLDKTPSPSPASPQWVAAAETASHHPCVELAAKDTVEDRPGNNPGGAEPPVTSPVPLLRRYHALLGSGTWGRQPAEEEDRVGGGGGSAAAAAAAAKGEGGKAAPRSESPALVNDGYMAMRRRHMALSTRLKAMYVKQSVATLEMQDAVNFKITHFSIRTLKYFFFALGMLSVLALAMAVLGMLNSTDWYFISGVHFSETSLEVELAGYPSWEAFTASCCCVAYTHVNTGFPFYAIDVENWMCENGKVKERVRRDAYLGALVDGYAVRDLCGMTFKGNCSLELSYVSSGAPPTPPWTEAQRRRIHVTVEHCEDSRTTAAQRRRW